MVAYSCDIPLFYTRLLFKPGVFGSIGRRIAALQLLHFTRLQEGICGCVNIYIFKFKLYTPSAGWEEKRQRRWREKNHCTNLAHLEPRFCTGHRTVHSYFLIRGRGGEGSASSAAQRLSGQGFVRFLGVELGEEVIQDTFILRDRGGTRGRRCLGFLQFPHQERRNVQQTKRRARPPVVVLLFVFVFVGRGRHERRHERERGTGASVVFDFRPPASSALLMGSWMCIRNTKGRTRCKTWNLVS
jgi:hypothetical protein